MECKYGIFFVYLNESCELIDTLWNVNLAPAEAPVETENELIDTLWNVNIFPKPFAS